LGYTHLKIFISGLIALLLVGLASITTFKSDDRPAPRGGAAVPARIPDPAPAPAKIDYARLESRLNRLVQEDPAMVGLAVGVVEGGEVRLLRGFGEVLHGSGQPVTPDTVFRWASVSKGVAASLVAKLAEEGKLKLDDPVNKHIPSLRLPGGGESQASVTDLLSHRLGLNSNAYDDKLEEGHDVRLIRASLAQTPPRCPPGTCHAYQNVAFDGSSELVERLTGKPMPDVMRERLFKPLGMNSASATIEGLIGAPSWARGHVGGDNPRPITLEDAYFHVPAAGGVSSSIRDLTTWMMAQMGRAPAVLSPKLLQTVHAPLVATPGENGRMRRYRERLGNSHYGLGWRSYDYAGHQVVGHRGGVDGYRSLVLFDPALQTGVVVLWNGGSRKPTAIEFELMDMVYGLEPRDWMELDGRSPPAEVVAAQAAAPAVQPAASPAQPLGNETRAQTGR